ncbi:inositol monophosphatase family protein [Iodidimonas sp. SYSU 1G8]|uniref:inositol monophosphatase family protein n=1 Tax=Iodidimonas sp. SYSU 1G8 TaxID=3133967 RepID=UPI0031FED6E5
MAVKSAIINVMANAALKTAPQLVRDFGEVEQLQVSKKGPSDFVSMADLKAEKTLHRELSKARPDFGFMMEEQGTIEGADKSQRWIIDPLDGTTNFLHGIPHFAISIGYEKDGEILAGVVYDPVKDEMFWAERGRGAWMNDRRLRVSGRSDLSQSVLATGIPHFGRGNHREFLVLAELFMARTAGIRRMGAASLDLAYVAAGRYEAFWEAGLSAWDVAAGQIIVREAGGYVTDYAGRDKAVQSGEVLAANDQLHASLSKLISETRREIAARAKTASN